MTWPIKDQDALLPKGEDFAPHEGLSELPTKAAWEESVDPAGFSPSEATFKGGADQPPPAKRGDLEQEFKGSGFSELTGKRVDLDDTPKGQP